MIHLMKYKLVFFVFSTLVILPGLFYLVTSGLKLGIDFTGGALLEYSFFKPVNQNDLSQFGLITPEGNNTYIIRTKPLETQQLIETKNQLTQKIGEFKILREENVGPVIGNELKQK